MEKICKVCEKEFEYPKLEEGKKYLGLEVCGKCLLKKDCPVCKNCKYYEKWSENYSKCVNLPDAWSHPAVTTKDSFCWSKHFEPLEEKEDEKETNNL